MDALVETMRGRGVAESCLRKHTKEWRCSGGDGGGAAAGAKERVLATGWRLAR